MTTTVESPVGTRRACSRRQYRALSIGLVALVTLQAFEAMAVATAMPVVARELDGMSLYNLAFSATLAASVIATVLGGRWSDVRGPLRPIGAGVGDVRGGGCCWPGSRRRWSCSSRGRFVQGLGTGLTQVALYVLVARAYPPEMHPRVFAAFSAAWVVPSMIGPAIAGFIAESLDWRWIFLGVTVIVVPSALLLWRGMSGRAVHEAVAAPAPGLGRKLVYATLTAVAAALIQYGSALKLAGLPLLAAGIVLLAVSLPKLLLPGSLRAARGLPTGRCCAGWRSARTRRPRCSSPSCSSTSAGLSVTAAGIVLTIGALGWSTGSWLKGRGLIGNMAALRRRRVADRGRHLAGDARPHRPAAARSRARGHGRRRPRHRRAAPDRVGAGTGDVEGGRGGQHTQRGRGRGRVGVHRGGRGGQRRPVHRRRAELRGRSRLHHRARASRRRAGPTFVHPRAAGTMEGTAS
ncbi:MFS transporter [Nonomuraea rubra]|uniref:MFS transporter n=1 Tax=Nonomuraea rubra TaxID=46180 RepID=UPI0031E51216